MATKIHDRQVEHRSTLPRVSDKVKPTLKEILPQVNAEITPMFELRESGTPDLTVNIGAGKITNTDTGLTRTFSPIRNLFFEFTSGTVTYPAATGNPIVVSPAPAGVSENLDLSVGNFIVSLIQINSLGEITTVQGIEQATAELAANNVNFPAHFKTSLPIGYVILENVGGVIQNISNEVITQFEIGGGGGGSGDANSDITTYKQRLELSPFEYANTNVSEIDEDDQIDVASTATNDIASGNFKFLDSTAQVLLSIQQLDSEFLAEGLDVSTTELYSIWELDNIDTGATYEVSRDGGTNFQTITMDRIGASDSYRGIHSFTDEPTNAHTQGEAVANATEDLNDASALQISQKFTVANTTVYKDVILNINKAAGALGGFSVDIIKDTAGEPSTDVNDIEWSSALQDIASLSTGNNVVNISSQFVLIAGDYHLVIKPDDAYRTEYTSTPANKISAITDDTTGPEDLLIYNGTIWSAVTNETLEYSLEGREVDVRVKITSAATANDKLLSSYAFYYKNEDGVEFTQSLLLQKFSFDGTVDNDNEFILDKIPDSRLLMCFAGGTGQVFRAPFDFVIDGHKVIFPVNTFNIVGTVDLEFFQNQAVDGTVSNVADSLLTANFLGSTDATIDKSANGRGIMLRRPDGTLREITIDNADNIVIYSV